MFKRFIILASSFVVIASSVAVAQPRYHGPSSNSYYVEKKVIHVPARGHARQKEIRHHRWAKGQRMNDWRRHGQVRDYHRHGLRTPGRGQTWVKVDNNYLLLSMATGLVAAVTAAR